VEPTPEQAVATTKPRSAGPLPMENSHLMSQSQDLQFQRGPTPKPEGDQRNHCGQDRKHAGHDKAVGAKLQCLHSIRNYEQPQRKLLAQSRRLPSAVGAIVCAQKVSRELTFRNQSVRSSTDQPSSISHLASRRKS
jgi:hypothetical protein